VLLIYSGTVAAFHGDFLENLSDFSPDPYREGENIGFWQSKNSRYENISRKSSGVDIMLAYHEISGLNSFQNIFRSKISYLI
jgi:hypothetical protein